AGDASVGVDVHARVGADGRFRQDETVVGVGLERGAGQDLPPVAVVAVPDRHRGPARAVAQQAGRVDLQGADGHLAGERVADPVVPLVTAAAGLPAVVHLAGAAGLDGVVG